MLRTNRLISLTLVSPSFFTRSLSSQLPHSSEPKLCKDCRFYIANTRECSVFSDSNLGTGEKSYDYASSARQNDNKCGKIAVYFQENNYKLLTVPYYFFINNWAIVGMYGFTASCLIFVLTHVEKH